MQADKQYFYCYSLPLEPGSIVKPGNWGRIIKTYTPQTSPNCWLFVRELIFEQVRLKTFPNKPSRFDAIFLCLDEKTIKEFKNSTNRKLDLIYRVELVDTDSPKHVSDYTLANFQQTDNFKTFERNAEKYWLGSEDSNAELITTSRIRILELIAE